jgi:hypothetical protein
MVVVLLVKEKKMKCTTAEFRSRQKRGTSKNAGLILFEPFCSTML